MKLSVIPGLNLSLLGPRSYIGNTLTQLSGSLGREAYLIVKLLTEVEALIAKLLGNLIVKDAYRD